MYWQTLDLKAWILKSLNILFHICILHFQLCDMLNLYVLFLNVTYKHKEIILVESL